MRIGVVSLLFLTLPTAFQPSAQAQKPKAADLVKRALGRYDATRTFQCRLHAIRKREQAAMDVTMNVKAETDGKGSIVRSIIEMDTHVTSPQGKKNTRQKLVDDGRTLYIIDMTGKRYMSQPHRPDHVSKLFERSLANIQQSASQLAVSEEKVHGKAVYSLKAKVKGADVLIQIDKATLTLILMKESKGPLLSRVEIDRQLFNQPIPPANFSWTPTAEFKAVAPRASTP
jgi:outer membrane lipoprotein-sorting protein